MNHNEVNQVQDKECFVKEHVIYHENLAITRRYKVVYKDSSCMLLKNLDSTEMVLVKGEQVKKYQEYKPLK